MSVVSKNMISTCSKTASVLNIKTVASLSPQTCFNNVWRGHCISVRLDLHLGAC